MEEIATSPEQASLHQVQLCPACYLVIWNGFDGQHFAQGIPVPGEKTPLARKGYC
jgi:hypothetical protein